MRVIIEKYGSVKDRYKDYLKTKEGVDTYNEFKRILYSRPDSLIETLFDTYVGRLNLQQSVSVCDVGGGDGQRIISLSKKISERFQINIRLDFVEQSGLMCGIFDRSLKHTECFAKVEIINTLIENSRLQKKYDIIFLIHSIFCFDSFSIIQKLYNSLNRDGVLILVTNSGESFLGTLKSRLDVDYLDRRYELPDLRNDLKRSGILYNETSFETHIAIKDRDLDEHIAVILRWLSLGEYDSLDFIERRSLLESTKQLGKVKSGRNEFREIEKVLLLKR
jgi:hypothetical protein